MELEHEGKYLSDISGATLLDLIPPDEGSLNQYYGRIGNGKSYSATCDILDDLNRGQVVYNNWPIKWYGHDQRKIFFWRLLGIFGLKKKFWEYPKENYHYCDLRNLENVVIDGVSTGKNFYDWFKTLTSCICYWDEGHILYDSYLALKMKIQDRVAILDTRHYDRTINIISQRPTAIHVVLRANVNRFYKLEVIFKFWKWIEFRRTEFQDTDSSDRPNEEREIITDPKTGEKTYGDYLFAVSQKNYFGRQKIFDSYDYKFRRGGVPESQFNKAKIWQLNWNESKENFFSFLWQKKNKTENNLVKDEHLLSDRTALDKKYFSELKSDNQKE